MFASLVEKLFERTVTNVRLKALKNDLQGIRSTMRCVSVRVYICACARMCACMCVCAYVRACVPFVLPGSIPLASLFLTTTACFSTLPAVSSPAEKKTRKKMADLVASPVQSPSSKTCPFCDARH
eukprot:966094-Rhodomonas_salina.3